MSRSIAGLGLGEVPPGVLQSLRDIDPSADLVHLGGSQWLLGARRPNGAAREKLERHLAQVHAARTGALDVAERAVVDMELAKELAVLQLCADGFRPIQLYDLANPRWTFGAIVEDFRLRDYNWRTRPEAAVQELREEISFDVQEQKRTDRMREFIDQEGGSLFRYVMRRARNFLMRR